MFRTLEFIAIASALDFRQAWPIAGLATGFAVSLYLANKRGIGAIDSAQRMCIALPFLLAGGKLAYLLEHGSSWSEADVLGPGYSLYGSFVVVLGFWILWRVFEQYPLLSFLDCVTPGAALALALGRIGCFIRGCCGGVTCDLPWGVRYGTGTVLHSSQVSQGLILPSDSFSQTVHPTQLYESVFALVCFLFLLHLWRRGHAVGSVFFSGMLGYGLLRFLIEPIRFQTAPFRIFDLWTTAQALSLGSIAVGVGGLFVLSRMQAKRAGRE